MSDRVLWHSQNVIFVSPTRTLSQQWLHTCYSMIFHSVLWSVIGYSDIYRNCHFCATHPYTFSTAAAHVLFRDTSLCFCGQWSGTLTFTERHFRATHPYTFSTISVHVLFRAIPCYFIVLCDKWSGTLTFTERHFRATQPYIFSTMAAHVLFCAIP